MTLTYPPPTGSPFVSSPPGPDDLAAAGYVVAAPEFPLTNTAIPGPVGERDPAEQVRDVSFLISSVLDLARVDGPLRGQLVLVEPVALRCGPVGKLARSRAGPGVLEPTGA